MYPKQRQAIFNDARYSIVEASTKSGKTFGCMCWLLAHAWEHGAEGREFWWIARNHKQAKIPYRRLKRMLRQLQAQLDQEVIKATGVKHDQDVRDMAPRIARQHETESWIELINGARLVFMTGEDPDALYGEDVWAAVIDEATRCRREAFHALRSTVTFTGGPIRIIGNVKGRKNWVYELARKAEAGEKGMAYTKITAWDAVDAGILRREEIEDAQRTMPDYVFRELYLAEPAADEGNPFGIDAIRQCIGGPQGWRGYGPVVAWGWDLAKYVDWTVGIGLNAQGEVVEFHRFQLDWEATERRMVPLIGDTPALIDCTGVGDPIVERVAKECPLAVGQRFTPASKQELFVSLSAAIHREGVRYPEGPIVHELESIEYVVRTSADGRVTGVQYAAPSGSYDDCVAALALAVQCLTHRASAPGLTVIGSTSERQPSPWFDDDEDDDW